MIISGHIALVASELIKVSDAEFQRRENILSITMLIVAALVFFSAIQTAVAIYKSRPSATSRDRDHHL